MTLSGFICILFVCCWHHFLWFPTLILLWDEKGAAGAKSVCCADDSKSTVLGVIRISMAEKETSLLKSNTAPTAKTRTIPL